MARGLKKRKVADIEIAARFCVSSQMRGKKKAAPAFLSVRLTGTAKASTRGGDCSVTMPCRYDA
jgi:hypothetical protein